MNFLFEITPDYLYKYEGTEVFRAKVSYEISVNRGIVNTNINIPLNCMIYIHNGLKLAQDIWESVLKHAEVTIEENNEFKYIDMQERYLTAGD